MNAPAICIKCKKQMNGISIRPRIDGVLSNPIKIGVAYHRCKYVIINSSYKTHKELPSK